MSGSKPIRRIIHDFLLERGVRRRAFFGVLFACLAAGSSVALIGLAGWFIAASALAGISGAAAFIVAYPSSGIRAFAVSRVVFRYAERLANHRVTFDLLSRLRVHFFRRAMEISPASFSEYRSGDLLNRATADIDALDNVFPRVVVPTVAAFVACSGSVLFLAYFSPLLAAILAAGCVVAGVALPAVSSVAGRASGAALTRAGSRLRTEVVEAVEGLPEIRSYSAGDVAASRIEAAAETVSRHEKRTKTADATGTAAGNLAAQITTLAVLVAGLYLYQTIGVAGPIIALAILLATGVFEQLGALPAAYRALGVTRAASARLSEIFSDGNDDIPAKRRFVDEAFTPDIRVSGATFRYPGRGNDALGNISLAAESGSITALVGASGSGKTTLLKLLSGELTPTSGAVEISGVSVGNISSDSLANRVAYASQDEHIFDETLRENLLIAAPEASDDVLHYVLDAVALSDFLDGLEDGLDTPVGAHGREVSGGQRRRISVARALLRRPDILLFDEPTASLDAQTARAVLAGIRKNLPEATLVIATHDAELLTTTLPQTKLVRIP